MVPCGNVPRERCAAGAQCRPQRVRMPNSCSSRNAASALSRPRQVHGDDAHAAAGLPRAAQADAGKRRDAVQKALAQRQLMAAKALDALLLHKGQRGAQTVDAGQIRRAGFQPVRQIRRQQLTVRGAAGPACHKRREIGGKLVRQQQCADAARAEPVPCAPSRPAPKGGAPQSRWDSVLPSARRPAGKSIRAARRPPRRAAASCTLPQTLDACASTTRRVLGRNKPSSAPCCRKPSLSQGMRSNSTPRAAAAAA